MDQRGARHLVLVRTSSAPAPEASRDEAIERAVALLRAHLASPWTVSTLARRVALSRPVLARRFALATGVSPMRYLMELRMEHAVTLFSSDARLASIAADVGYVSEFAFNRAFKRHHGVAPGTYRRVLRTAGSQPTGFRAAA